MAEHRFETNDPATLPDLCLAMATLRQQGEQMLSGIPPAGFHAPVPNGWSPAENVLHLAVCNEPVAKAMALPGFLLGLLFGRSKQGSRGYAEVRSAYLQVLANGAEASGSYVPKLSAHPPDPDGERQRLLDRWKNSLARLESRVRRWSESAVDSYRLPHPLLGKLTLREMLFFTLYHQGHHLRRVAERWT